MAQTKLGETTVSLPALGSSAPDFTLTGTDLKEVNLKNSLMTLFPDNLFYSLLSYWPTIKTALAKSILPFSQKPLNNGLSTR